MPQSPHDSFIDDIEQEEVYLITLFILKFDPATPSTWQYYADQFENIEFDGKTYNASGLRRETIKARKDSPITSNTVKAPDPLGIVYNLWKTNSDTTKDMEVVIQTVSNNSLAHPSAKMENTYRVTDAFKDNEWTIFTLGGEIIFEDTLPIGMYSRTSCRHFYQGGFKSPRCGYVGTGTCDGTLAQCVVLANRQRFGGMPLLRRGV